MRKEVGILIIDKILIDGGITKETVVALIERHHKGNKRFNRLLNYYKGQHSIVKDKGKPNKPNNKVVNNYCKYIVDMSAGFFFGAPITYTAKNEADITRLIETYQKQEINDIDVKLFKNMSMYGCAFELVYNNSAAEPESVVLPPQQAFVVYDDTAEHNRLFGVHYRNKRDLYNRITGYIAKVYTDTEIITFEGSEIDKFEVTDRETHEFGMCPLFEYINNDERQGDYEQMLYNVDSYNRLQSDRVNDKEQFVDAFLFLKNIILNTDEAKKLNEEKVLISDDPNGDAKFLSQVLNEADTEVLKKSISDDIHKFSLVPDLSDEKFSGNASGVAIEYKLIGFENMIANKEAFFFKGLRERLKLYISFMADKTHEMKKVDIHAIDIISSRNLPQDDEKRADMIAKLRGLVSDTTLRGELSFVRDEESEVLRLEEQKRQEAERRIAEEKQYFENTGYNQTPERVFNNLDEE